MERRYHNNIKDVKPVNADGTEDREYQNNEQDPNHAQKKETKPKAANPKKKHAKKNSNQDALADEGVITLDSSEPKAPRSQKKDQNYTKNGPKGKNFDSKPKKNFERDHNKKPTIHSTGEGFTETGEQDFESLQAKNVSYYKPGFDRSENLRVQNSATTTNSDQSENHYIDTFRNLTFLETSALNDSELCRNYTRPQSSNLPPPKNPKAEVLKLPDQAQAQAPPQDVENPTIIEAKYLKTNWLSYSGIQTQPFNHPYLVDKIYQVWNP